MRTDPTMRLLGAVTCETRERLREVLSLAMREFDFYAKRFRASGVSPEDIRHDDPVELLRGLPLLEAEELDELAAESLSSGRRIIDMETSSGTTGVRKRRFISHEDDASETEFLAELFKVCGVDSASRVACLDTDPLTLMASFTKALHLIGVEEAYMYCVGSDFREMLMNLPRLDPTVIITVPSIIERSFEALRSQYAGRPGTRLEKIIFVGEPLSAHMRRLLESTLGVEIFGYYGASETSALGIECGAHDGIHLFTDHNLAEVVNDRPDSDEGELVVTTLRQGAYPLLRYALKDRVAVISGACSCGLSHPRVEVLGRADDGISILGAKITYNAIHSAVYKDADRMGAMQIVLAREAGESLTVVLPQSMRDQEANVRKALMYAQPDLDFLISSKHLDLSFSYVEDDSFGDERKTRKVVDLRGRFDPAKV
ncbi:MAG: phenylacetate--CoA ligase family protein [Chloroflexi bacterium]|nr:phenylacetate--CoA ligase family protein [Chloroflexota bacterium]